MEPTDPAFAMRGRTNQQLMDAFKDDMLIYIMRSIIESVFGGLWLFLLLTVGFALASMVRVWVYGFKDDRERREHRYMQEMQTRKSVSIFFCFIFIITVILLTNDIGRRVLGYGAVAFIFGAAVYHCFVSDILYAKRGVYRHIEDSAGLQKPEIDEKAEQSGLSPGQPDLAGEAEELREEGGDSESEVPQKRHRKKKGKARKGQ